MGENWVDGNICYPLAEEHINEIDILNWARKQPIFENWYRFFKRQGCMLCPMAARKEFAYMKIK